MSYAGYRRRGGRGGGSWDDPYYYGGGYYDAPAAPRPAPDERLVTLRQSIFSALSAARLVAREGDPGKAAKATELLNETRKALYRILAGDAE
jgi:hypothetical protein